MTWQEQMFIVVERGRKSTRISKPRAATMELCRMVAAVHTPFDTGTYQEVTLCDECSSDHLAVDWPCHYARLASTALGVEI